MEEETQKYRFVANHGEQTDQERYQTNQSQNGVTKDWREGVITLILAGDIRVSKTDGSHETRILVLLRLLYLFCWRCHWIDEEPNTVESSMNRSDNPI